MKTINKYIFGILLSSVLLTVGCGSSSSNNPVSTGNINSGLVNVKGNVTNLEGNGTVAFYPPSVAVRNSLNLNQNSSFRTSVSNNGVYTFNVDEKGNYTGQIPAGDYYVIAQNSDASLKSVSAKLRFSTEITNPGVDITLRKTYNISGKLVTTSINASAKNQMVYIENTPFVTLTNDDEGNYSFESIPASSSYTICSNIATSSIRYHFKQEIKPFSENKTNINLNNYEPITLNGKNCLKGKVEITPTPETPYSTMVSVITESGEFYNVHSDLSGNFIMPIETSSSNDIWFVDNKIIKDGLVDNTLKVDFSTSPSGFDGIYEITIDSNLLSYLSSFEESSFTLLKLDNNKKIISSHTEMIYNNTSNSFYTSDTGTYVGMLKCKNYSKNNSLYTFSKEFEIDINSTSVTAKPISTSKFIMLTGSDFADISNYTYKFNQISIKNLFSESDDNIKTVPIVGYLSADSTSSKPAFKKLEDLNLTESKSIDFGEIFELASGSYNVYFGYEIHYYDNAVATITSDPYPYVKH